MGEWKRLINVRYLFIIGVAVLANILLFGYEQFSGKGNFEFSMEQQQRQWLVDYYASLPIEDADSQIIEVNKRINSELHVQSNDSEENITNQLHTEIMGNLDASNETVVVDESQVEPVIEYYHGLSEEAQSEFLNALTDVQEQLNYLAHYYENVISVIENAEKLERFSIFSSGDSYSNRNIQQTAKDYRRVENVQVSLENNQAVEHFLNDSYLFYVGLALMVLLVYNIFKEKENGMWSMVHGAEGGRARLVLRRIAVLLGASLLILFLLYGSVLVESFILYGGVGCLGEPVQNLEMFSGFTYDLSQGIYLLGLFMASWLAMFTFSGLFWMLFVIFRNRNHALVAVGMLTGIEILLYQRIPVQSIYGAFKRVNIVRILHMNEVLSTYENWNVWGNPVSVWKIMIVVLMGLMLVSFFMALVGTVKMRPQGRTSMVTVLIHRVHEWYQHLFMRMPILVKEFHKLVITSKGTWVVFIILLLTIYFSSTGEMHFTSAMKEKDEIYLEHGGEDFTYVKDLVQTRRDEYMQVRAKAEEVFQNYQEKRVLWRNLSASVVR